MSADNFHNPDGPHDPDGIVNAEPADDAPQLSEGKAAYNTVTDLVAGPNVRLWDNLIQVLAIVVCIPIGALIGYLAGGVDRGLWAVAGGFFGLLAGLFGSGAFLMVYRAVRHARGKHD